jgi:D-cysteine desulfhydrase
MPLNWPTRVQIGAFPTPLQKLSRLSAALGREIWTKRDDLSGVALGGNKARKLQFLIADALATGCDVVIATGYVQSNNVVQTAAAARAYGLRSVLVLTGHAPDSVRGNLLLARLLGAEIVFAGDSAQLEALEREAARQRSAGAKPYVLPPGGSTGLGVVGFVEAVFETKQQCQSAGVAPDCLVFPTGTGGTQAGLALGLRLAEWPVTLYGVSTGKTRDEMLEDLPGMANAAAVVLGRNERLRADDFIVDDRFYGEGYARPGRVDFQAIVEFAQLEGHFLDPVYTGRAMHGLRTLIGRGELPGTGPILFWNTGGTAALFAFDQPF